MACVMCSGYDQRVLSLDDDPSVLCSCDDRVSRVKVMTRVS